jgi:hypothetical protein
MIGYECAGNVDFQAVSIKAISKLILCKTSLKSLCACNLPIHTAFILDRDVTAKVEKPALLWQLSCNILEGLS